VGAFAFVEEVPCQTFHEEKWWVFFFIPGNTFVPENRQPDEENDGGGGFPTRLGDARFALPYRTNRLFLAVTV
jgi:hypothetical protein